MNAVENIEMKHANIEDIFKAVSVNGAEVTQAEKNLIIMCATLHTYCIEPEQKPSPELLRALRDYCLDTLRLITPKQEETPCTQPA
jgi:hypothetical protein